MADLLNPDTSHERNTLRTLLLAATALVAAAAIAFAVFYHHENHAPMALTSTRTLSFPLHTTYTHVGKTAGGPEGGEDATYVVTAVHVQSRASIPLFIRDIDASLELADGTPVPFTRVKAGDVDRLLSLVPALKPVLQQIGVPPLQPEQAIAAGTAADGYVLLLFTGPQTVWNNRKTAELTFSFYHQDSATISIK